MNIEFLKEVLSIPSISGNESMVREYIINFARKNGIECYTDFKGNLYLTKGNELIDSEEFYPCVVAHMDTVHRSHIELIESKTNLVIETLDDGDFTTLIAKHPETNEQTGIGGDDKCGVYVCLEMLLHFNKIKAAFFVEEEIGMKGSKESDEDFFENVGYTIQFDAPSSNWITEVCSGQRLFDTDFKELITEELSNNGYTKFSNDPFTDVNQLVQKFDFCCLNLGCGYYQQHSNHEYVIVEEVEDSVRVGKSLINKLGLKFYRHKKDNLLEESMFNYFDNIDDFIEDEYDEISESIVNLVIELYNDDVPEDRIKELLSDFLRGIY